VFSISLFVEQIINGLITGSMYALMAIGLSLIWGILDLFNFAHGALYMLGAYVVFLLVSSLGINLVLSTTIAILVMFALGLLLDTLLIRPLRKLQGKQVEDWITGTIVVTLGFGIFAEALALVSFGPDYRSLPPLLSGMVNLGFMALSKQMLLSFFIAIFLISFLGMFLKYSKIGLAMRAIAQEPEGARLMGINTNMVFPITFGVCAALAGATGALLAPIYNIYPSIGWVPFANAFNVVVIGGLGSIKGSIIAGFLIGVIGSVGVIWLPSGWIPVITFGLMIVVLIIRPTGLFGISEG
jgi:branched-chain amino acid transport system permease protein